MALVTLEQAKAHLRVTSNDQDADIDLKSEQASAIILDYLKSRANNVATVTSSSVASPTVITTVEAHGFANGDTVVFAGDDSTPSLDGSHTVSNVTTYTFTVPIAVTVAGTGGTATVAWTDVTAPGPVQAATLLMLAHLYDHRGDDAGSSFRTPANSVWDAVERLLMRSRDPAFA